jgi:hypothetical protein
MAETSHELALGRTGPRRQRAGRVPEIVEVEVVPADGVILQAR